MFRRGSAFRTRLILPALFLAAGAGAQEPLSVTLEEAVGRAMEKNALLQAARAEVQAVDGMLGEARSYFIPDVTLSESFSRTNSPVYVFMGKLNQNRFSLMDFDIRRLNDPDPLSNFNTRVEMSVPLFTGGKLKAAYEAAKLGVEAARERSGFAENSVVKAVTEAFYGSLLAGRSVLVTEEALKTAEAHRDQVRALHEQGMALDSDWLRIQVYVADLREQLFSRKADERVARAWLAYAMGLETEVAPSGTLTPPQEALPPLERSLEQALGSRPDLKAMELELMQAGKGVRMARSEYMPQVGLMASYDWNTEEWSRYGENWMVGVQVTLPLFDGGARKGRVLSASAREIQAAQALLDMQQRARVEVRDAWLRAEAARRRVEATTDAAGQSRENLRIVELRYKEGLASITDLLDADTALLAAELTRSKAIHDEITERARLRWALGEER